MKTAVTIFVIVTVCFAFQMDTDPESKKIARECALEHGVNLDMLGKSREQDLKMFLNMTFLCFGKCLALKSGIVSETGKPILEAIDAKYNIGNNPNVINGIKLCGNSRYAEYCTKFFNIRMCIMRIAKTKP